MPELGEDGLLPPGVHDMSPEEIRKLFGAFQHSDRRPRLFDKLQTLIGAAGAVPAIRHIIIDGSFVTAVDEPGDIDIVVAVSTEAFDAAIWPPREYNLLSSKRIRQAYKFDAFVVPAGSAAYAEYLDLFSRVKGAPERRKGVVRVVIHDQE